MAPHSCTLAWRIPWTEEPGRLRSMGSQRVGHDWATEHSTATVSVILTASATTDFTSVAPFQGADLPRCKDPPQNSRSCECLGRMGASRGWQGGSSHFEAHGHCRWSAELLCWCKGAPGARRVFQPLWSSSSGCWNPCHQGQRQQEPDWASVCPCRIPAFSSSSLPDRLQWTSGFSTDTETGSKGPLTQPSSLRKSTPHRHVCVHTHTHTHTRTH